MLEDWGELLPEDLRARGVPLDSPGPFETAWPISVSAELCAWFSASSVAVLGGDMYVLNGKRYDSTAENWYTELGMGEPWKQYCERSVRETLGFLSKFLDKPEYWFTVVAARKPDARQLARSYAR